MSLSLPARVYDGQKYAEIVPVSKRYKGKVIRSRSARFHDIETWRRFVYAVNALNDWLEKKDAWAHGLSYQVM